MKRVFIFFLMLTSMIFVMSGCKNKEEQLDVEEIYRIGLSRYLLDTLNLEEYDKELSESQLNYIPNDEKKKSIAQKKDKLGLTYIYLRNELHLERLAEEDIELLKKETESIETGILSDEAMRMIINTFPDVISQKQIEKPEDKNVETMYDNNGDCVKVNTLVLRIGTKSEFDENGYYVDKEHEAQKQRALEEFSKEMETTLNGKIGDIPIRVQRDSSPFSE